jgi:hypothetical protein
LAIAFSFADREIQPARDHVVNRRSFAEYFLKRHVKNGHSPPQGIQLDIISLYTVAVHGGNTLDAELSGTPIRITGQ